MLQIVKTIFKFWLRMKNFFLHFRNITNLFFVSCMQEVMKNKCWLHTQTASQSVVWQLLHVWRLQDFWLAIFLFWVSFSLLHNLHWTLQLSRFVSSLWHLMARSTEYQAENPIPQNLRAQAKFLNNGYVSYTTACACNCVWSVCALMSFQLCHTHTQSCSLFYYI